MRRTLDAPRVTERTSPTASNHALFATARQLYWVANEVELVVEAVMRHAAERPQKSLGVITLGITHANRIEEALRIARLNDPGREDFFSRERTEPFFVKNLERVQGDERDHIILAVGYGKRNANGSLTYHFGPLLQEQGERRLNVAVSRAKEHLALFATFDERDMDPRRSDRRGVELLRDYITFVRSGGADLGSRGNAAVVLNPFEISVRDAMLRAGIDVLPQYGVAGYRIDFVARHPTRPGELVMAIECDGASYHARPTARDRDRLRQEQLESLGWCFHRIWSTDWFNDADAELARIRAAFDTAVARADARRAGDASVAAVSRPAPSVHSTDEGPELSRGPRPSIPRRPKIDDYSYTELVQLVDWIESDTRLRTEDELVREAMTELGFRRLGSKIDARLRRSIQSARARRT